MSYRVSAAVLLMFTLAGCTTAWQPAGLRGAMGVSNVARPSNAFTLKNLHNFRFDNDGSTPYDRLVADDSGNLFGTTAGLGEYGNGTVFELKRRGEHYKFSVIYAFRGGSDGTTPWAGLIVDGSGNLYGTTTYGGGSSSCSGGCGTVFKLTPSGSGYTESVIYAFHGQPDGSNPYGPLLAGNDGVMYGTTFLGGASYGTVFELVPSGHGYKETLVYAFQPNGDSWNPPAGLAMDNSGALYGTGQDGGAYLSGAVFKLTPAGSGFVESVLYSFPSSGSDGKQPESVPYIDQGGNVYGTTIAGGASDDGTVFKLTPMKSGYTESVVYSFQGGLDGAAPYAGLVTDGAGNLYGTTTSCNDKRHNGTVYELSPAGQGYTETVIAILDGPYVGSVGGVIIDKSGILYGTSSRGPGRDSGSVFRVSPGE